MFIAISITLRGTPRMNFAKVRVRTSEFRPGVTCKARRAKRVWLLQAERWGHKGNRQENRNNFQHGENLVLTWLGGNTFFRTRELRLVA